MNIALVSGLIILILLVIMLIAGVPIAVALGISSVVAILPIMDLEVAVVTGAQRIFSGISMFSLLAIPFFIPAMNNAATEVPPDTSEKVIITLLGGISRPVGAVAMLAAAEKLGS